MFLLAHTNEFVGTCKCAVEPTPACCGVNQCRRVYERKEIKSQTTQGGLPGLLGTSFLGTQAYLLPKHYIRGVNPLREVDCDGALFVRLNRSVFMVSAGAW
jgi:hypothetical protein